MIIFLENSSQIKVVSNEMLLIINVGWFFPNTKARVTKLLKILREYDTNDRLSTVLDSTYKSLLELLKLATQVDNRKLAKQLVKNIDQIKIFNGLYGDTIPEWKEKDKSYAD